MRIITRGDFDGLISATLLSEAENISDLIFAEPKAMQDGEVEVTDADIIVNLPFYPGCAKWFDHHISEQDQVPPPDDYEGVYALAPSCARLIYDYYNLPGWEQRFGELLEATDKIDSADLTLDDILRPKGWVRLANTIDPRTGFRPSARYFYDLMEWIRSEDIDQIMRREEVNDRVRAYFEAEEEFKARLQETSRMEGKVVFTDLREEPKPPVGSRFLVYALYPAAIASVRAIHTANHERVHISVGKSVLNRVCHHDIGTLLTEYGGGGHVGAGSCQVDPDEADDVIGDIIDRLSG